MLVFGEGGGGAGGGGFAAIMGPGASVLLPGIAGVLGGRVLVGTAVGITGVVGRGAFGVEVMVAAALIAMFLARVARRFAVAISRFSAASVDDCLVFGR